jgi:hypothetical protein
LTQIALDAGLNGYASLYEAESDVNQRSNEAFLIDGDKNFYGVKNVIEITDVEGLRNITSNNVYILLNDLVLEGEWTPITDFLGVFSGDYHAIKGLRIDGGATRGSYGLFGHIQNCVNCVNPVIRNVAVIDAAVAGEGSVGAILGSGYQVTILNSCSTGSVKGYGQGSSVGGIAGNVWALNQGGASWISNSYSTASVSEINGSAGGIVGTIAASGVRDSYSTGEVSAGNGEASVAGGIVGSSGTYGSIENGYSTGKVSGLVAGGILGSSGNYFNYYGWVSGSAALNPSVTSSYAGRLVGCAGNTPVDGFVREDMKIVGSSCESNAEGTSKPLAAFLNRDTYAKPVAEDGLGWDFEKVWKAPKDGGYPILYWQID